MNKQSNFCFGGACARGCVLCLFFSNGLSSPCCFKTCEQHVSHGLQPFNQTCHTILEKNIPTNTAFLRKNPFLHDQTVLKTKVIQGKNTYCIAILQKDPSEKKHFSKVYPLDVSKIFASPRTYFVMFFFFFSGRRFFEGFCVYEWGSVFFEINLDDDPMAQIFIGSQL